MKLSLFTSVLIMAVIGLFACGHEEEVPAALTLSDAPLLQFHEVASPSPDQGVSYIVAFRELAPSTNSMRASQSFLAEAHKRAFQAPWIQRATREPLRYLARLNLSNPGRSFEESLGFRATPYLQDRLPVEDSLASLVEVSFANEQEARLTLTNWLKEGRIWYAEPNGSHALKGEFEDSLIQNFENDERTPWLQQVGWIDAIKDLGKETEKSTPIIAVMDSGVDVMHTNLKDAVYVNESGANKLCKNDFYGCNTTKSQKELLGDGNVYPAGTQDFDQACPPFSENCEHGTHVAGIIAARGTENYVGLCPYCQILVVKVVEVEKKGEKESFVIKDTSILAGLAYVSGFKSGGEPLIRVINASFGKFERSRSVELFIRSLKNFGKGTLVIAAAGNEDTMKRQYPAAFEDVLAVANVQSDSSLPQKSPSSNFGMWVDIAAPGDGDCRAGEGGIDSTVPGGGSECKRGTSMAAPVVAGIAGLILTKEPNLSASALEVRLRETAVPDALYQDGTNNGYRPNVPGSGLVPLLGSGIVNAAAALDPSLDKSPTVVTQRSDRVRSGCGLLGIGGGGGSLVSWLLLGLPLLLCAARSWKNE